MKLNATPRHYMPLSQSQSDDDESGPSKEDKHDKLSFRSSYDASERLAKEVVTPEVKVDAKSLPMSVLRIIMFIMSLILCVLFIVVFIFFIPCKRFEELSDSCRLTYKWKRLFPNISYIPPLDLTNTGFTGKRFVIFGFTNDESGLIAIDELTGERRWRLTLHSTPLASLCNVIDVNSDGVSECLVVGKNGLFAAIDIKSGTPLWYLHNHGNLSEPDDVYGPIIVPDCDNDDIFDIIVSYDLNTEENNFYLALISGGTGQVIGSLLDLPQCSGPVTSRFSWKTQNVTDFVLFCAGEKNGKLWMLSSDSVCEAVRNETNKLSFKNVYSVPHFVRDVQFYKVSYSENFLVVILDGIKFILLEKTKSSFHVVWKRYFRSSENARVLTDGQFIEGGNQLIVLSTFITHSKISGLNLLDGRQIWTITQDRGVVTSSLKLHKHFGTTDGLILKIVSLFNPSTKDKDKWKNSSQLNIKIDEEILPFYSGLNLYEEKYVLLKCGKMLDIITLSTEEAWSFCENNICHPDIYMQNVTALAVEVEPEVSYNLITFTSSLSINSSSADVIVKHVNLRKRSKLSKCSR